VTARSGSVEQAVRRDLRKLDPVVRRSGMAEMALALGRALDGEFRGTCVTCQREADIGVDASAKDMASVARELRATLLVLTEAGDDSAAARELQSRLSTPVGDATPAGATDIRTAGRRGRRDAGDAADAVAAAGRRRRPGTGP
jgi:hypothetical protein